MIKCSPGSTGLSQPIECDWQISCCFQRLKSLQFARITALSPSTPCNFRALRTRSTASNRVRHIRGNPSLCLCTRQTLNLHSSYTYTRFGMQVECKSVRDPKLNGKFVVSATLFDYPGLRLFRSGRFVFVFFGVFSSVCSSCC